MTEVNVVKDLKGDETLLFFGGATVIADGVFFLVLASMVVARQTVPPEWWVYVEKLAQIGLGCVAVGYLGKIGSGLDRVATALEKSNNKPKE